MKSLQLSDNHWPDFVAFGDKHFGISHIRDRRFNEHWFRDRATGRWTARVLVADDQRVVGIMMLIVVRAKFDDQIVPFAWISTGAVEGFETRAGAGAGLYFWAYKSFPIVGAMSGNENSIPINALLGDDIKGVSMRRFIYIHHHKALDLCLTKDKPSTKYVRSAHNVDLRACLSYLWVDDIPDDYEELWDRFRAKFSLIIERDRQYMIWRYVDAPYINYKLVAMRYEGILKAFIALRFESTPVGYVCRVVDFIADDDRASEVWRCLLEMVEDEGVILTDFMVIGSSQDSYLLDAGFFEADRQSGLDKIPVLLSPVEHRSWTNTFHIGGHLAKNDQNWRQAQAIYFTKSDSDRDWPTAYYMATRKDY